MCLEKVDNKKKMASLNYRIIQTGDIYDSSSSLKIDHVQTVERILKRLFKTLNSVGTNIHSQQAREELHNECNESHCE
jgi:hypothetical protein